MPEWKEDEDGDLFYDGNCVCPHDFGVVRVGFDWGKLALFDSLEKAKTFVEQLSKVGDGSSVIN